jgi:Ca2+-binding EF-hand superfamily protein
MSKKLPMSRKPKGKTAGGISEEQKAEIREAFDLFDTDGSGTRLSTMTYMMYKLQRCVSACHRITSRL